MEEALSSVLAMPEKNVAGSGLGHFETKSDACHRASIGLIVLQELTFWRSASKVGVLPKRSS